MLKKLTKIGFFNSGYLFHVSQKEPYFIICKIKGLWIFGHTPTKIFLLHNQMSSTPSNTSIFFFCIENILSVMIENGLCVEQLCVDLDPF